MPELSISLSNMTRPPRLHWGWVFLLNIITLSFFGMVWLIVQSNWVRKTTGKKKAFVWAILHASIVPAYIVLATGMALLGFTDMTADSAEGLLRLIIMIFWTITVFVLRSELESPEIGIPLGGIMTFFFGPIYFQYHLQDYDTVGQPLEASA